MAQQPEALKACGPCSKRKVRCDQNTPCANCTNRNENCTRSRKEQFKEPIGIQGPDPYPTRPSRSEPVAERLDELDTAPGWIARRSGDQFFSDWLLHPTSNQVPAGTPLPEGGIGGPPIGFDLRYGQWVYKRPYGSQLPSMVVGVNQRGDWAYALDQQSDPSVATGSGGAPGAATGSSDGGHSQDRSHDHRPSGTGNSGRGPPGSGQGSGSGDTSGRRRAEDGKSSGSKNVKRSKPSK